MAKINLEKTVSALLTAPTYLSDPNVGTGVAGIAIYPDPVGGGLVLYSDTDTYDPETATGTYQVLLSIVDGVLYAGGGDVSIDSDGINLTADGTANGADEVKWYRDGTNRAGYIICDIGNSDPLYNYGSLNVGESNNSNHSADVAIAARAGSGRAHLFHILDDNTASSAALYSNQTDFNGLIIASGGSYTFGDTPSAFLHLKHTAPSLLFQDTTASAKSMKVTVDGNNATFEELGGQDFMVFHLANSTPRIILGYDSSINNSGGFNSMLQLYSTATSAGIAGLAATRFSADTGGAELVLGKSRGATIADYTVVQSGDTIGEIRFAPSDGSDLAGYSAAITSEVDGTPGTNDLPGRLRFLTTADGANTPTERIRIDNTGKVYINDSSNANMTLGLTINQGANDDLIFDLKSSDVAHGMTDLAETDTFFTIFKHNATAGGTEFYSFSEDVKALVLSAIATNEDATRSTSAIAPLQLRAYKKSGTGATSLAADKNMVTIGNDGTVRFIFDSDGDSHQDVGTAWTNFDEHDDMALLNILSAHVTKADDPLKSSFGAWLEQGREILTKLRLVQFNDDGHHFVNWSRMHMLEIGALRQLDMRLKELEYGR